MTTSAGIDRDAPVIAHHEIDIAAPLDMVWNLHTDVERLARQEPRGDRREPRWSIRPWQLRHLDQLRLHRHLCMTEAEAAVRRCYESLSTRYATLVDEVLTPDAKTPRCPAISAHAHN